MNLKEIIDDYVKHMHGVNDNRVRVAEQELKIAQQEAGLFSLLCNNLKIRYELDHNQEST